METKKSKTSVYLNYLIALVLLVALFIPYFGHLCPLFSKSTPIVTISTGKVQGRVGYSLRSGKEFYQFLSIPYAEAPVGELRFAPPVPLTKSWEGVKQVIRYPPKCSQYESMGLQVVQGVEDCLFINVFVSSPKKVSAIPNRPVLVHIHGGGFVCGGSNNHHPDFFMDQDGIVLVTMNYRLGPYGFLNLAEADNYNASNLNLPRGNMGLKDQLLALQWIQTNIAKFGGDPRKVMIFGESAGAASVHFHMLAPKSRGLFRKAMSISGTALSPWAIFKDSKRLSKKITKSIGCLSDDKTEMLECLRKADMSKMMRFQRLLQDPTHENDLIVPSVEVVKTPDTFLEEYPIDIIKKGNFAKIPWLLGVASGDGTIITARFEAMPMRESAKKLENIWASKVAFFIGFEANTVSPEVAEKVKTFYGGSNASISSLETETFLRYVGKVAGDTLFYRGAHKAAVLHAKSGAPTRLYYFNYTADFLPTLYNIYKAVGPNDWLPPMMKVWKEMTYDWLVERIMGVHKSSRRFGITHTEDLYQMWNLVGTLGYLTWGDRDFSDSFVKTIVSYAAEDENAPLSFRGVSWPPFSPSDLISEDNTTKPLPAMLMDNTETPKFIPEPYVDSLQFWDSIDR